MPQRIRCRFDVFSSEISGLPADTESVKLVVDHQKVSKRYAASDTLPTSEGITQLEDPADTRPLMSFICHVYPSKEVNLRLMGSSARDRPSLLSLTTNWTQLATATLPLDQLAQQLLLPGVAASPPTPRASTEFFTRPQITIPEAGIAPQTEDIVTSPTLTASPPPSPFAAANSFSRNVPAHNLFDEEDDVSELFTTDSAAAAVTGRRGQVGSVRKSFGSSKGSLGDMRDAENDINNDDVSRAAQDGADVPPAAVGGRGSAGGYEVETQSSRFFLKWTPAEEGLDLQQQLVVHAHILQPSRTSMWVQALASPKKAASIASSRTSRHTSSAGGSGFQRRKWADKLYNSLKPDTPAAGGTGVSSADVNLVMRGDGSGLPAGGSNSAPAAPHNRQLDQAAAARRVNVHGRLPSFEPWVESDSTTTGTAAPPPTDTSHLPAGHPLKFFGSQGPSATPHNTPAKPPVLDTPPAAAAGPGSPQGTRQQLEQQQMTSTATTADAEDQAAKHEFLQLILATLSSSHSMESDAALPPPSAAQLAAAASLPRTPAAADLEAFAFATGLPIDKVAEAAASKLGTGSSPASVTASDTSSTRTSPRGSKALPTDKQQQTGEAAAAAAVAGASEPRAAASDVASIAQHQDVPATADVLAPEVPHAPVPVPTALAVPAVSAKDLAPAEEPDVALPAKSADLAPATAAPAALTARVPGALDDTVAGSAMPQAAERLAPTAATVASGRFETAAAEESSPVQPEAARAAPGGATAAAPDSPAVGTSAAAALAAAVSEAVAAAEQGEVVTIIVESVETAAGAGGEQVAVPVITVAEAALVPSGTDSAAAADSNAAMSAGTVDGADVGSAAATASEPTAVVTATAIAVLDDSSPTAAAAEQSEAQGWEPQQLAVATTAIKATPVDADTAAEQSGVAAGHHGGVGSAGVIVTSTTDVAITNVSDAELADFAAPVATPGAPGLDGRLAPVHHRGESLGLGAVGEGSAVELLQPGSRSTSAAVEEANRTAAVAKSAAAAATAWAASHNRPVYTSDTSVVGVPLSAGHQGFGANGVADLGHFSPAGPAADVESVAVGVPVVAGTAGVVQPIKGMPVQQSVERAAPFASQEALDMYVASSGPNTAAAAAATATAPSAVGKLQPAEETVIVLAPSVPSAVVSQLIPEQEEVEGQVAPLASKDALDMYVASSGNSAAAAAPSAVSEIQPAEEVVVVLAPGEAAAVIGEVETTPEASPAVQESITSHPGVLLLGTAAARSAQPGQQQAGFDGQPALLRLQQRGSELQSTPSGTSRLAEVLERISSQPLSPAASAGAATAETWRRSLSAALPSVSNGESGSTQGTRHSSLMALGAMLAAAGSLALAIPAFLFSTLLAALSLAGNTAVRRARARRSSSGGAVDAAQREVLITAANTAYYQGKRAAATALELALYIPRRIAFALFNLWLLMVTALVVRPSLALLDYIMPQAQAMPGRNVGQMSAVPADVSQPEAPAATSADTTAASTDTETSAEESSSRGGVAEDLQANAVAVELLSGTLTIPTGGWLMRMRESLSRSPSVASSIVPPTPAPSLEADQVYSGLMERSWSSMLSLITPLALSRSPSVSSVAATPPSTPLVTSSDASFTSSTGVPQLDLSPATSATSVTAVVAGPTLGSSSSRPLARKSRLGQSAGPGLATIASVTDLVAAAAESAGEADAAPAADDTEAAVDGTTTLTDDADTPDGGGAASPWVVSSWLWSAVSSTAGPAVTATYNSNSQSWWPAWMSSSTQLANGDGTAVTDGQDVMPPTPTPSVASGWLPGWMQYSRSSSQRSSAGSQVSTAAADGAGSSSPGSLAGDTETRNSAVHGGTPLDSAVDMAPRSWLGFLTYQSAQWCHVMLQLLNLMFMPVAWYVDAVTSVLRSGVHTTTWLVELAVWWALLPGRLAWWSVTLPWKAAHAVLSLVLASNGQSSSRQHVGDPVTR